MPLRPVETAGRRPCFFFFSSRRRHTRCSRDWSSDVCSSDLTELAERFPQFRRRLASRLPMLNQVNRQQAELLRRYRAGQDEVLAALLLSINCIAAGFGTTG